MYVCVCMYVCMYVRMCACMNGCMYVCANVCGDYVRMCVCVLMCVYMCDNNAGVPPILSGDISKISGAKYVHYKITYTNIISEFLLPGILMISGSNRTAAFFPHR